jgi:hypothetical protein
MNRNYLWIALACLMAPIIARALWFYPGFSARPAVATPDYKSLTIPTPPIKEQETAQKVKARGGIVVVDMVHGNQFKPEELNSLAEALKQRGARLEFDNGAPNLETRLKYASAYVIVSPSFAYTSDEMRLLNAFVNNGGRLVVFTDATRGLTSFDFLTGAPIVLPDANLVNPILAPYDITVNTDYLYNLIKNEGNFRNIFFDEFNKNELTFGLKEVAFYGAHSVKTDSGLPLFIGAEATFSSITDAGGGLSAAALSENGNVLALGDFTFLTPPYNGILDNTTLISNIADFMLGGTRKTTLADFPYIFSKPAVNLFPASEVQLTAEMIGAISRLQTSLNAINVNLKIAEEKPEEGDLLVLGTSLQSEDLAAIVEPFNLTIGDSGEFVTVPGFGNVGIAGNGLILFEPGKKGNTVTLLADTNDDLTILLDTLSGGGLSGCVVQGNIGVCSIGFGGSFSDGSSTPEAAPQSTPTAGG